MMATLVTLEHAKTHLRVDTGDEDALITGQLAAAEALAVNWIRRKVFATSAELEAASAAIPAALAAATLTHASALLDANALTGAQRVEAAAAADEVYASAQSSAKQTRRGILLNDLFISAALLTLGALYEKRDVLEPPSAAQWLLDPLRAYA